ncbi:HAD family hydrolase [archaeon]|nr:HAD family hydrolase [archaeon]MBL7056977.1 HAD family hydrolase [Candidatus Woesearchaeota archaeon]
MQYKVSHGETFEINTLVLDLNGTLSVNGWVLEGVKERIDKLNSLGFKIILFTGNQRGTAGKLCGDLGIEYKVAQTCKDKEEEMLKLDTNKCAAIGNARIDIGTFKHAKLSILTLQAEGIHAKAISHVDIIVPSILDALDLFINKDSLCATLRE